MDLNATIYKEFIFIAIYFFQIEIEYSGKIPFPILNYSSSSKVEYKAYYYINISSSVWNWIMNSEKPHYF